MAKELKTERPDLEINIIGLNQKGHELGNPNITADRTLPWLQDLDADGDGSSDVWLGSWPVEYRDVVILDKNNVKVDVYNLTLNDLADTAHYQAMKNKLIAAAVAASEAPTFSWTNAANKLDVNNDTHISPIDALLVVNELNTLGGHALPTLTQPPTAYLDTTEDGFVSPLDALSVINELSRRAAEQNQQAAAAVPAASAEVGELLAEGEPSRTSSFDATTSTSGSESPAIDSSLYAAAADAVWSDLANNHRKRTA